MTKWLIAIESAAPSDDERPVAVEQLVELARVMEECDSQPSASGGGHRYGVVLGSNQRDPIEVLSRGFQDFYFARQKVGLPEWPIVRCELLTSDEFGRRRLAHRHPRLVVGEEEAAELLGSSDAEQLGILGAREATEMLGVTRQRFQQLADREDFPHPIARVAATPLWLASSIESYASRRKTTPGRPPASWTRVDGVDDASPTVALPSS